MDFYKVKEIYKEISIKTASPIEVKLRLLEICLDCVEKGIESIRKNSIVDKNKFLTQAQMVIIESSSLISLKSEPGKGLFSLYRYINERLIEANIKDDILILTEIREMLMELVNAWGKTDIKSK